MCEIQSLNTPHNVRLSFLETPSPDFCYCSLHRNVEGKVETFYEAKIKLPYGTVSLQLPETRVPLGEWTFSAVGFRFDNGLIPICQKTVAFQTLLETGTLTI